MVLRRFYYLSTTTKVAEVDENPKSKYIHVFYILHTYCTPLQFYISVEIFVYFSYLGTMMTESKDEVDEEYFVVLRLITIVDET